LILSAAVHALVLGIRFELYPAGAGRAVSQSGQAGPDGSVMRAFDLVVTPEAVPAKAARSEAVAPAHVDEADRPEAVSSDVPASTGADVRRPTDADPRATLRERLAPRMTDRRLWIGPVHTPADETAEAVRIRAPISDGVRALNDSIASAEERERLASDWTTRDEAGGRWGISPDRVHLGGLTLKLRHCTVEPCEGWLFPTPADRKDEYENRQRGFAEIRLQASRAELEEALGARATAIRKRMDAQRDSSRGGGP
jgi:hypothetical protein